ncbi:hypothetical protein M514_16174 [Trichuris suis]|uniref:Uncharacterized protein n=1 Tax=Trichuris suis TaxID=68888 RepID=A0A085NQA8_9BILA|nr:hypothetical protein M514_16174 [Trichuris suis]
MPSLTVEMRKPSKKTKVNSIVDALNAEFLFIQELFRPLISADLSRERRVVSYAPLRLRNAGSFVLSIRPSFSQHTGRHAGYPVLPLAKPTLKRNPSVLSICCISHDIETEVASYIAEHRSLNGGNSTSPHMLVETKQASKKTKVNNIVDALNAEFLFILQRFSGLVDLFVSKIKSGAVQFDSYNSVHT